MDELNIKQRLKNGECIYGPFVRVPDPVIIEALGYAGFDFAIIDMEHGPMGVHQAENLVRAAKLAGIAPMIRIRQNSAEMITRALDTGAAGVQIPQINTPEAAKYAVESGKFHPLGLRGTCKFTRNAQYSHIPTPDYFQMANENTLTIVQIEGAEGVAKADEILDTPGIDIVFLGPYDLSQALGMTGQVTHPDVLRTIEEITNKARKKNIAVGSFTDDEATMKIHRDFGIQYLSYGIDTGLFYRSAKKIVTDLHK